jgi:hypothetical protein
MRAGILSFLFGILLLNASAQSVFVPINAEYNHLIERYEIKNGQFSKNIHSNIKSIRRKDVVNFAIQLEHDSLMKLSNIDKFNLKYLENDSWEWLPDSMLAQTDSKKSFLKYFLRKKTDFYHYQNKDFDVHINPILHFAYGKDNTVEENLYTNGRGIEMRGTLNKKLSFYSMLTENQIIYPKYVRDYIRSYNSFQYEGLTKVVDSDSVRLLTDFFSARGYITFQALKNLQLQFGHDKNFVGSGIRSMILSDFSAPYLYLKAITQVGRFQYMNIFAQLSNRQISLKVDNTEQIPPKYLALHHLSLNITKNFNIGLFETVAFGKRAVGFDLNYLNPIIFLRYIEGHLGSVDNSIIGFDFKYNFLRHFSIYGQYVIDEFSREYSSDWWGKKYAGQIGGRYIDVFNIKNLDFQTEYNFARPYTYSHYSSYSNFVHYNLPLAHPLGANFKESIYVLRYQPTQRLSLASTFLKTNYGVDEFGFNYGGNILKNNRDNRPSDYNNRIGQGRAVKLYHLDCTASYMFKHNLFFDLKYQFRNQSSNNQPVKSNIFSLALRWNVGQKSLLF